MFFTYQIGLTIVDDNQWEPDEEFFVKLTIIPGEASEGIKLWKTCIMEITILNDDGEYLHDFNKYVNSRIKNQHTKTFYYVNHLYIFF